MSKIAKQRIKSREARHNRVRRIISGSAERPRFCVRRSLSHVYAQIIDDESGKSIVQVSSLSQDLKKDFDGKPKTEISKALGKIMAEKALEKGISKVVFDRGGYLYHGRIKAVADAAREAGLNF